MAQDLYDAVIVGGGPAGLTAALYLARARYRVVVVEKDSFGGQIQITDEVVNYPGVFSTTGKELTETMRKQAEAFGAEFLLAEATELDLTGDVKKVKTTKGELECLSVLLATGATPRSVGFAGEEEFKGHGVAYCATCDGEFFSGKEVFVIGGGFAAAEEAVFLTKYAKHVTMLVFTDDFTCAPAVAEPTKANEKIDILYNTEVLKVEGDSQLRSITWKNRQTGEETTYTAEAGDTFGVFVFVGYAPATELIANTAKIDKYGYVITDESNKTTADGLFAAGDVTIKPLRQVATAVGEAAQTATEMEKYIKAAQDKTGLAGVQPATRLPKEDKVEEKPVAKADSELFDEDMLAQLNAVFDRMANPVVLRVHTCQKLVSDELQGYMSELAKLSDKLTLELVDKTPEREAELPFVEVVRQDGTASGLEFHGVPGGHEFTSFVLGLYNVAGPGQPIDEADKTRIAALDEAIDIKLLVGLSCTMCPETVLSAQRIAADNSKVSAHVFDINHFADLKDKYNVMSVPCTVITKADGSETVSFGKKNLSQMLDLVG